MFGGKVNTLTEVVGLDVTKNTVATTKWMHTSGPSVLSAIGLYNTRVLLRNSMRKIQGFTML